MILCQQGVDQDATEFEVRHDVSTRDGDLNNLERWLMDGCLF